MKDRNGNDIAVGQGAVEEIRATLDEIRERHRNSTPGVWDVGSEGVSGGWCGIYAGGEELVVGRTEEEDVGEVEALDNATFIAYAHQDIPTLLNIVEELLRHIAVVDDAPAKPTCTCDLRDRQWNPNTGRCQTCGDRYEDRRQS